MSDSTSAIRGAFGTRPASVPEHVAVSTLECDVLQQASDLLSSELQTPGVQQAQELIQHVLDSGYSEDTGPGGGPMQMMGSQQEEN